MGYLQISIGTPGQQYFDVLLSDQNVTQCDELCQSVTMVLFVGLCNSSNNKQPSSDYVLHILKVMQQQEGNILVKIIQDSLLFNLLDKNMKDYLQLL